MSWPAPKPKEFCKRGHLLSETRRRRASGQTVCMGCRREYDREWRQKNPKRHADIQRKRHLKYAYGLTPEQFTEILQAQNHLCRICNVYIQAKENLKRQTFAVVDHDHATGEVRGIICNKCNSGLGMFDDDAERLQTALNYLRRLL